MSKKLEIGQAVHLGDGAYMGFDGYHAVLMANSHLRPTDRVFLEPRVAWEAVLTLCATFGFPGDKISAALDGDDEASDEAIRDSERRAGG